MHTYHPDGTAYHKRTGTEPWAPAGCSFAIRRAVHGDRGPAAALGSNSPVGKSSAPPAPAPVSVFSTWRAGAAARANWVSTSNEGLWFEIFMYFDFGLGGEKELGLGFVFDVGARAAAPRARSRHEARARAAPPHRPHAARHWLRAGGCGGARRGGGGAVDCEDPRGDGGVARAPLCPRARGALARARRSAGRRALGCGRHTRGRAGGRRRQGGRRRVRAAASRWGRG